MKKKTVGILLLVLGFTVGIASIGLYLVVMPQLHSTILAEAPPDIFGWKFPLTKFPLTGSGGSLAYSDIRTPSRVPEGLPVRLQIPSINVDSAIEDALITPDGRMDVPAGSKNVAWFALGPHPGQVGSAVIGGHFGISNGVPWVFYNLDTLKVGDIVSIVDDRGATISFVVRSMKSFDRNADATTVFTSDDGIAHLNLITCEGIWNKVNGSYPQRLVVFTDAVSSGTKIASVNSPVFYRSLDIGASGSDVVALQSVLEEKGFLTMPGGVAKGYFGALTHTAVANYQVSVGLLSVGTFGPLTRAALSSGSTAEPILPSTGIDKVTTEDVFKKPIQILQNLYATPLSGSITFSLLFLIGLLVFKIKNKS